MTSVSVVIPTHEKPERLNLTLHALLAQDMPRTAFEVIVVADGCTAPTGAVLDAAATLGLPLQVRTTARVGQAAARNRGAERALGHLLVFLDDDVLLCPHYLSTVSAILEGATVVRGSVFLLRSLAVFRDPERGIPYEGPHDRFKGSRLMEERIGRQQILEEWASIDARCRHLNRFERLVREQLTAAPPRTPWLGYSGSGVALSRAAFEAAGGYDEAFGLGWGAEALELGYRLWREGAAFRHIETIRSAHMDHPRGAAITSFAASFDRFFEKHGDPDIRLVQRLIDAEAQPALASPAPHPRSR